LPVTLLPSGEQIELVAGDLRAVVTTVGATLRCFDAAGVHVLWPFPEEEIATGGRGQVLSPWPNRLEGGRFQFDRATAVAPLNEPERGNAIHGLVRWLSWAVESQAADAVVLRCTLEPQPGYPWRLFHRMCYKLDAAGLSVTFRVTNMAETTAPFAIGFHPYLFVGPTPGCLDRARLVLPVSERLVLDSRGLPVGAEDVAGSAHDFRPQATEVVPAGTDPGGPRDGSGARAIGRTVGTVVLDDCFTGMQLEADGRWHAHLIRRALSGSRSDREAGEEEIVLSADSLFSHVMCFSGDTLALARDRRVALALEPMTAPPNALRTQSSLARIAPGAELSATWTLSPWRQL
jgi:aldose 1-epimerase